jgi:isoleucyl-tRNA synthetase
MRTVREIVSSGLEARAKANIKVRQPLRSLDVRGREPLGSEYEALILDEINVKEIRFVKEDAAETAFGRSPDADAFRGIELDTKITPELRAEGMRRDLVRLIQAFRKEQNLTVSDRPTLTVATSKEGRGFIESVREGLVKDTGLASLVITDAPSDAPNAKDLEFPIVLSLTA